MTKALMIVGTASSAGKSTLVCGLARLFSRKGLKVLPFKSQNMSTVYTLVGDKKMATAQAMQAEAAGQAPRVEMNPILLVPTGERHSEVWLLGEKQEWMASYQYYREKGKLWPQVQAAYESLARDADLVLVEGAGSPAEINLMQEDFVNLGLAERLQIPALLVGDIDRGGVFASLYGTLALLPAAWRTRVKGLVINKFRGDKALLEPALDDFASRCGQPVLGVLPFLPDLDLQEEDSLSAASRGVSLDVIVPREKREASYDRLADMLEANLDLDALQRILA